MNELIKRIEEELQDEETRYVYAEDFLNTYVATQIKVLREEKGWTQAQLADKAGMKQERISVLEDVNYQAWTASVLKRLARALDVRLSIRFESFGSYLKEFASFNRDALKRPSFNDDPAFGHNIAESEHKIARRPPQQSPDVSLPPIGNSFRVIKGGQQPNLFTSMEKQPLRVITTQADDEKIQLNVQTPVVDLKTGYVERNFSITKESNRYATIK